MLGVNTAVLSISNPPSYTSFSMEGHMNHFTLYTNISPQEPYNTNTHASPNIMNLILSSPVTYYSPSPSVVVGCWWVMSVSDISATHLISRQPFTIPTPIDPIYYSHILSMDVHVVLRPMGMGSHCSADQITVPVLIVTWFVDAWSPKRNGMVRLMHTRKRPTIQTIWGGMRLLQGTGGRSKV